MVAFAAVVTVIYLSGFAIYNRLGTLEETLNRHLQAEQVLATLDTILDAMLDQETGVRGYVITGNESFLGPYYAGEAAYTPALQEAKTLTSGAPAQEGRLDELNKLTKQWREIAEREIALMAMPQTREEARALVASKADKRVMDLIRTKVDETEAVELDLSVKSLAVHRHAYASAYQVTIFSCIASLVLAVLMALLLTRGITVPVRRMTNAMSALAKGDTRVQVPGVGRKDEIGAMAAAVQFFRDGIVDRNRAQEALQESEEKWKAVFENNPTMYFMTDATDTVLSVNHFGAEQLGYTVDELIGTCVLGVFYEPDRAAAQRNTTRCIEQLGRSLSWELRKVRKDGSMLWVRETAKATLIRGRPVVLIVCEDITERKRAEHLITQVFETSPDGVYIVGGDYLYQRANPAYGRNLTMPVEDIVGRHIADLLGAETFTNTIKPNLERCFAGEEVRFAGWINYPSGRRYVAVTYSPLRWSSEKVEAALVISRDLTNWLPPDRTDRS
jgi:PAS domain S-box-containing protein